MKENNTIELIERESKWVGKEFYVKSRSMEFGPYLEIFSFADCDIVMGLSEHNDDTDVLDGNGKIIYNDTSDNWEIVRERFHKVLSIGYDVELFDSIFNEEKTLLLNDSVQHEIFKVFNKRCAHRREQESDKKTLLLYKILDDYERNVLTNKFRDVNREYKECQNSDQGQLKPTIPQNFKPAIREKITQKCQ